MCLTCFISPNRFYNLSVYHKNERLVYYGIILLNMGKPPLVNVITWLLQNSIMFETDCAILLTEQDI